MKSKRIQKTKALSFSNEKNENERAESNLPNERLLHRAARITRSNSGFKKNYSKLKYVFIPLSKIKKKSARSSKKSTRASKKPLPTPKVKRGGKGSRIRRTHIKFICELLKVKPFMPKYQIRARLLSFYPQHTISSKTLNSYLLEDYPEFAHFNIKGEQQPKVKPPKLKSDSVQPRNLAYKVYKKKPDDVGQTADLPAFLRTRFLTAEQTRALNGIYSRRLHPLDEEQTNFLVELILDNPKMPMFKCANKIKARFPELTVRPGSICSYIRTQFKKLFICAKGVPKSAINHYHSDFLIKYFKDHPNQSGLDVYRALLTEFPDDHISITNFRTYVQKTYPKEYSIRFAVKTGRILTAEHKAFLIDLYQQAPYTSPSKAFIDLFKAFPKDCASYYQLSSFVKASKLQL